MPGPDLPPYLELRPSPPPRSSPLPPCSATPEHQLCTDNTITLYAHHGIDLNTTPELHFETSQVSTIPERA
jgi:hypothetical protein